MKAAIDLETQCAPFGAHPDELRVANDVDELLRAAQRAKDQRFAIGAEPATTMRELIAKRVAHMRASGCAPAQRERLEQGS